RGALWWPDGAAVAPRSAPLRPPSCPLAGPPPAAAPFPPGPPVIAAVIAATAAIPPLIAAPAMSPLSRFLIASLAAVEAIAFNELLNASAAFAPLMNAVAIAPPSSPTASLTLLMIGLADWSLRL